MKKISVILGSLFLISTLAVGSAIASPVGSNLGALQGVFDDITVGGPSSVNVATDYLNATQDSTWELSASGGSVSTMIIEIAGFAGLNTFGVYDSADNTNFVTLFDGANVQSDQVTLSILVDGSVKIDGVDTGIDFADNSFGYFLDSSAGSTATYNGGKFYSNSGLNADGLDHMLAYQGVGDTVQIPGYYSGTWDPNEYILAFEDIDASTSSWTDWDYTDMVVMVESVNPVPEPATMLLFGTGLIGLAGFGSRKRSRKNA